MSTTQANPNGAGRVPAELWQHVEQAVALGRKAAGEPADRGAAPPVVVVFVFQAGAFAPGANAGANTGAADRPGGELTDCEQDILDVLTRADKPRLTKEEILRALQQAGKVWGDSTVSVSLAAMVKVKRVLENARDGKGYALRCDA